MTQPWEQIVDEHAGAVYGTALRILGHAADAEDVVQEVLLEAFQRFESNDTCEWTGLLKRMAVFRAMDRLRRRRSSAPFIEPAESGDSGPVDAAIACELETRLRNALRDLPARESEVFWLRYFEDLENREIADALGISAGAVAAALSRARSKLQTALVDQNRSLCNVRPSRS